MNYRSKKDMQELSNKLLQIPVTPLLCAGIIDNNLMIPSQILVRLSLWSIKRLHGNTIGFWEAAGRFYPAALTELVELTAKWIINGKDKTTKDAAGGFNQDEVDILLRLIYRK